MGTNTATTRLTERVRALGVDLDGDLQDRLAAVERRLHEVLEDIEVAGLRPTHLIDAGGKRLRPLLALLGAQFGDPERPGVVDAAVVTELVHVATLHHDDVMDEATVRHGVATANALWGNNQAVLLGDLLLARAAELGAGLGTEALRLQVGTLARLVHGQLLDTTPATDGTDRLAHCITVMTNKSASLIALAVRLGALVAGAEPADCAALANYGELLGVAFQISDDLLDICSPGAESGKEPGTDLREGVVTLPMVRAMAGTDDGAARLRTLLADGPVTDPDRHAEALALLRCSPGLTLARADARGYAQAARTELSTLPPRPATAMLSTLCTFASTRAM